MSGLPKPRVFISYSHDSDEHRARVLLLAQTLRGHGAVVELDQFHGARIVNWPDWCRRQISREQSDFVICVCTAEYRRRINDNEQPEQGRGVFWEGTLMQSELYDEKRNRRFIAVLFDAEPETSIIEVLRGWTFCRLDRFALDAGGYELLYRILTGQAFVEAAPVGEVIALPTDRSAPAALHATSVVVEITHLPAATPDFLGRTTELASLDEAWTDAEGTEALVLVAPGGTGKSSLVRRWLEGMKRRRWDGAVRVFGWSFYSQGTAEDRQASEEPFFAAALAFFGVTVAATASIWDKAAALARAVRAQRTLLILDGLEPLQYPPGPMAGELKAPGVQALLKALVHNGQPGLCVITTREAVGELAGHVRSADHPLGSVRQIDLGNLCAADGARLLHRIGVQKAGQAGIKDDDAELLKASEAAKGHALTLRILGLYLARAQ
ncbi:MAG TPA: TIR domain-containing protein, partial [Plasticicumulans sp.]|nr:TIR domain-containing protein [Plasticicumulans sp.]